jgi:AcrR family transcriptional regulator
MTLKKAPDVRKDEIFEAALYCFNQKGYYEASIEDIAEKAGISKGGIYHHFSSKKSLFIELFRSTADKYFESLKQQVHENLDTSMQVQDLVARSHEVFNQNLDILKFCLEFVFLGARDPDIRAEVTRFYTNRISIFSDKLTEGTTTGAFKKISADGVSRTLYFLSMGFFLTFFTVNIDFDPMVQHTINMKTVFEGIKKIEATEDNTI